MSRIGEFWDDAIVPTLVEYIRIPAKSPHFDRDWKSHGFMPGTGFFSHHCAASLVASSM